MPYEIACRTGRLSAWELSCRSRFTQDGEATVRIPELPWNDFQMLGLICSTKSTAPDRSNWAEVVSSVTTRNTTFL